MEFPRAGANGVSTAVPGTCPPLAREHPDRYADCSRSASIERRSTTPCSDHPQGAHMTQISEVMTRNRVDSTDATRH